MSALWLPIEGKQENRRGKSQESSWGKPTPGNEGGNHLQAVWTGTPSRKESDDAKPTRSRGSAASLIKSKGGRLGSEIDRIGGGGRGAAAVRALLTLRAEEAAIVELSLTPGNRGGERTGFRKADFRFFLHLSSKNPIWRI
jgi:hypothetical protein